MSKESSINLKWVRAKHPSRTCYKTIDNRFCIEHDGTNCWALYVTKEKRQWIKDYSTLKDAQNGATELNKTTQ